MRKMLFWSLAFIAITAFISCEIPFTGGTINKTAAGGKGSLSSYNYYYGSFHNHTQYSDGLGADPAAAFAYARDTADLDYLGMCDHAESLTSTEWTNTLSQADAYTQDGVFVAMRGFEWTSWSYGHVCVLGSSDYASSGSSSTDTLPELVTWVNARDCIATFNHPGEFNSGGTEHLHFNTAPSDKFVAVELFGDLKFFSNYFDSDGYYPGDGKNYLEEAVVRGWKTGAGGGFDEHEGTWGTAIDYRLCILAPSLTRANLMDGLKTKRFFSTSDKNAKLYFEINGSVMGSTIAGGTYDVKIQASDGDGETFTKMELLKNGDVFNTWNISTANPDITYSVAASGGDYYYVVATESDGDRAISSPVWISGGSGGVLVGNSSSGSSTDRCNLDISLTRYQASASGSATQIKINLSKAIAGGKKVKCAVYSDNSGAPGSLLQGTNELTAPGAGWQTFTLSSPVAIASGTYYWLVAWSNDSGFTLRCNSESGNGRYKRVTYGSWPNPMVTGLSTNNVNYCMYAQ